MKGSLDDETNNKRKSSRCLKLVQETWLNVRRKSWSRAMALCSTKAQEGKELHHWNSTMSLWEFNHGLTSESNRVLAQRKCRWYGNIISFRMRSTPNFSFYLQIFLRLLGSGQLGPRNYRNVSARGKQRSWVGVQSRWVSSIKWRIGTRCWLTIRSQYSEGGGELELILTPCSPSTWSRTPVSIEGSKRQSHLWKGWVLTLGRLSSSHQSVLNSTRGTSMQSGHQGRCWDPKLDILMMRRTVESHAPNHVSEYASGHKEFFQAPAARTADFATLPPILLGLG